MLKVQILQVGETKEASILSLENEYEKWLSKDIKMESLSVKASKSDDRSLAQEEEKTRLIEKLDQDAYTIALDERGKQLTSEAFAELIQKERDFGPGKIQFLIGGSNGLHPELIEAADLQLSFSKMTFTHEMIRPFLKEQIYRAYAILKGKRYHK